MIEVAERQAGRPLPHARRYLTVWTVLWAVFFWLRAAAFVWMAYNLSLNDALLLRMFVGPLAFGMMFVIEPISRRLILGPESVREAAAARSAGG